MIASPGDVLEERNLIRDIVHEWNDLNSMQTNLVLMPVGWETHSSPDLGGRPQALINKNVLDRCDLLVGVFWTRLGTPTGEAESGTAEEIRRHVDAGKPAMVYFSTAPVAPQSLNPEQYRKLGEFKDWCRTKGLIAEYENLSAFSEMFRKHIQLTVRDNNYLKKTVEQAKAAQSTNDLSNEVREDVSDSSTVFQTSARFQLTAESRKLLLEASKDKSGVIMSVRYLSGQAIQTNGISLVDSGDRRSVARWEAALGQLLSLELIVARGNKNEIFEVTAKGFEVADTLGE